MQNPPKIQTKINPLAGLMRQPKIYVTLPSNGKYWPEGSLNISSSGEYPVFSMTAKDELTLKTPDALLNGQAVVEVLESCIPNIIDGWQVPQIDLDALLIAIRMATYGNTMDNNVKIGDEEAVYSVDLRLLLEQLKSQISWDERIEVTDSLIIYVRPLNYRELSKASIESFETQRILNLVNDKDMDEDKKIAVFKKSFNKLTEVTLGIVANSIYRIDTNSGSVTDQEFIKDFIAQCDREIFNAVKNRLDELKEKNSIKPMRVQATAEMIAAGSAEEIEVPIMFDTSNFFE